MVVCSGAGRLCKSACSVLPSLASVAHGCVSLAISALSACMGGARCELRGPESLLLAGLRRKGDWGVQGLA
eukprot:311490-Prorocentrum_lima.AAC.1